ncbi:MAG TPA: DMT family transporter [Candidatus Pullichristensenella stercorigallinarum]|uniref:DMT family transporter n=1 Tax=Candidatus Pullichristensenella stercorigallinarum TaxID=2840909 RepID=A0A9D0ZNN0_9FIRM|nr:DMT family transporter [Candidatus Pullichristensenella stercorigallinarum]
MNKQFRGGLYLALAAFIWGMAFSAQSEGGKYMGPFAFTAVRSLITFVTLMLFELVGTRSAKRSPQAGEAPLSAYIKVGVPLGVVMFAATALQQLGLSIDPSTAKSGFITALYIVIVPLLGLLLYRKRVTPLMWVGVALAVAGLALLCLKEGFTVGYGDLVTLACAVMFAIHIVAVDRFAGGLSAPRLCCVQFGVAGVLALAVAFCVETVRFADMLACWPSLLYVGVCSGALGYTLQIAGQKYIEPTIASLILCLESVFAAVGGWLLLGQTLTPREIVGCALMLAACMLAQLPEKRTAHEGA